MDGKSDIRDFYKNKRILVTGATGFLGKVLVEKLLRVCDVDTVFLLIRTKKGVQPTVRLNDYISHMVFDKVRKLNPKCFEKLKVISGDISLDGLDMSEEDKTELIENCELIFHCAANVRFDLNLKDAVNFNTSGTDRVLKLAEKMKKLIVFTHVSTAYSHCKQDVLEEKFYPAPENPYGVIKMTQLMKNESLELITPKLLDGLPNTYALTKSLTEELVYNYRDKVRIVVARPSIVTASYLEPMPGFIEGVNGPTGLMIGASRGVIRSMHCNPNYTSESFPVDMTSNCILACAWKRAQASNNEVFYCNITESGSHPITWGEAIEKGRKIFYEYPLTYALWFPDGSIKSNYYYHMFCVIFFHYLPAYVIDFLLVLFRQKPFLVNVQHRVSQGLKVLQYYTTKQWIFRNTNMLNLYKEMSAQDKETFFFDLSKVDYDEYLKNYVLGTRHYLLKEKPETLPKARALMKKLYYLDRFCKTSFFVLILYYLYKKVFSGFF